MEYIKLSLNGLLRYHEQLDPTIEMRIIEPDYLKNISTFGVFVGDWIEDTVKEPNVIDIYC